MLDDLFTYRLGESCFLTVTNAANHARDLAWMQSHGEEFDADVRDRQADFAMLAVQGPRARALVQELADGALPPRLHCCERTVAGVPMLVCGTGYTGEDGVELLLDPDQARRGLVGAGRGGRAADRARRPRHAAARGLLPPLRQRSRRGPRPDRSRPRLGLR